MLVGRAAELSAIAAALENARDGRGSSLCVTGAPGIGKTSLLDAAEAAATGFRALRATGLASEIAIGHAALAEIINPLRDWVPQIPPPQRAALETAMGWSAAGSPRGRFLVGAAAVSLLSMAAQERPILVLIDDLQWIDRESLVVLLFAARRISRDAVLFLMACRDGSAGTSEVAATSEVPTMPELAGINQFQLSGLSATDSAALLSQRLTSPTVIARLVDETAGNPLAILETARQLSAAQLRGSAPLPQALPVGHRLGDAFLEHHSDLSVGARRALLLTAVASDQQAGPVAAALRAEGFDPAASLSEVELFGAVVLSGGALTFRHPLIRSAVWQQASPADRRSAHGSLAAALGDRPAESLRHRAEATIGFDDHLAAAVRRLALDERSRLGYAASSALFERAAQLSAAAPAAADALASAIEDAVLSGDVLRARTLARAVGDAAADVPSESRARVLFAVGFLEQNSGSVPESATLLRRAAELGTGTIRLRALVELAQVSYRLGSAQGVAEAADALAAVADLTDPEQEMLARYTQAAALAFAGSWEEARPPGLRALELLESEPALRDDPRYLVIALLAAGWIGEPERAIAYLDRRIDAARARGAIGVLPLALDIIAAGAMVAGQHQLAYANAGEVVELGRELGYVVDVGSASTTLAIELAARGRHDEAAEAISEAKELAVRAGVDGGAVMVHLAEAFCALCRGDFSVVVEVLEQRIAVDDGRLPRGDYPLSVAPDLAEAYLALGRRDDALAIAARHAELHGQARVPELRADALRIAAMVEDDADRADGLFRQAHAEFAQGHDPLAAGRTRLLHGARLRRSGNRIAAREQLRVAADTFRSMGLDLWTERAEAELAATGARARRGTDIGDSLTSQETRVALLVARGQTNRGIAAALFLSPKTVEHHITSILRKRGLKSRTELAVSMTGQG